MESLNAVRRSELDYQIWQHWPVNWTAVFIGALTALALSMIFALAALALGAHDLTPEHRVVDLRKVGMMVAAIAVFGAFLSFVAGGWAAGKIAGILHSEPAMLHGAITWLVALPLLALLSSAGVGGYAGSWYSGLSSQQLSAQAPFHAPEALAATATEQQRIANDADWAKYRRDLAAWNADAPRATRNSALCAVSALIIGLLGSVIGGWMASGEPMSLRYRRPPVRVS